MSSTQHFKDLEVGMPSDTSRDKAPEAKVEKPRLLAFTFGVCACILVGAILWIGSADIHTCTGGPGLGALTSRVLGLGRRWLAVEQPPIMIRRPLSEKVEITLVYQGPFGWAPNHPEEKEAYKPTAYVGHRQIDGKSEGTETLLGWEGTHRAVPKPFEERTIVLKREGEEFIGDSDWTSGEGEEFFGDLGSDFFFGEGLSGFDFETQPSLYKFKLSPTTGSGVRSNGGVDEVGNCRGWVLKLVTANPNGNDCCGVPLKVPDRISSQVLGSVDEEQLQRAPGSDGWPERDMSADMVLEKNAELHDLPCHHIVQARPAERLVLNMFAQFIRINVKFILDEEHMRIRLEKILRDLEAQAGVRAHGGSSTQAVWLRQQLEDLKREDAELKTLRRALEREREQLEADEQEYADILRQEYVNQSLEEYVNQSPQWSIATMEHRLSDQAERIATMEHQVNQSLSDQAERIAKLEKQLEQKDLDKEAQEPGSSLRGADAAKRPDAAKRAPFFSSLWRWCSGS